MWKRRLTIRVRRIGGVGMRLLAIVAAAATCPIGAGAETNQAAIAAAMGIWGYIKGVDVQIDKCREIDPTNADSYDRAYVIYHQDATPLLMRIDMLLSSEMARAGAPMSLITDKQKPIIEMLKRQTEQAVTTNPNLWLAACRELPDAATRHIDEFRPLRERFPNEMRLIDEWR